MTVPPLRRAAAVTGALVMAATGLAACASGGGSDTITLYNGQHVQTTDALVQAFEQQTGIQVKVRSDDESVLADQIVTEGSHSPADVLFTENTPPLAYLETKGLLVHLNEGVRADTQVRYDSSAGDWVGVTARVSVIVYNPAIVKPDEVPTSVLQLADPRYKGLLALAPGETDFQPIVTSVLRAEGKSATVKWLEGLKANAAGHIYPDNETITSEVNAGQAGIGVINQYYWYRLRAEIGAKAMHSVITHFAPRDPGYVIDVSGAAVLRSSQHQADAIRFVKFLTTKKAQEIIGHSDSFEYPIDSGVTTAAPETPFADLRPNPITLNELGTGATAV
jgi:iron(III) transport system substrate-binding protein